MHTIYCFNNGGPSNFLSAIALGDDGVCLATHCCSDESFMPHDLGITSEWKHELYNEHFGVNNWQLEWVSDPHTHEGLKQLLQKLGRVVQWSRNSSAKLDSSDFGASFSSEHV